MTEQENKITLLQEEVKHAEFEMALIRTKLMNHTELEEPSLFRNYNKHASRIVNAEAEIQRIKESMPEYQSAVAATEEDY